MAIELKMTEIRCEKCKRLLFKANANKEAYIEVKCPKCGHIDKIHLVAK